MNETLSDLSPLVQRFVDVGVSGELSRVWFASLLRDGFALTSVGMAEPFSVVGRGALMEVLHGLPLTRDRDAAVEHVMAGFADLGLHPDVVPGIRALHAAGLTLVTLSNGAAVVAERLLTDAGIRREFTRVLTVEETGIWKPAEAAYQYAARVCGVDMGDMLMVAVHPWDLHGAARAGLRTAWINRDQRSYPSHFQTPDYTVSGVEELAAILGVQPQ